MKYYPDTHAHCTCTCKCMYIIIDYICLSVLFSVSDTVFLLGSRQPVDRPYQQNTTGLEYEILHCVLDRLATVES